MFQRGNLEYFYEIMLQFLCSYLMHAYYTTAGQSNFQGKLCLVPTMVTGLADRKIIQVACGSTHTLFLCDTVSRDAFCLAT